MIFDIGANEGQSLKLFTTLFPRSEIHAFEPDPAAFALASRGVRPGVHLHPFAMGETDSEMQFNHYTGSDMSSFLEPGRESWSRVESQHTVTVRSVDSYCAEHGIDEIDILKSDTQGFDGAVLRGARRMLEAKKIGLIKVELTFMELYQQQQDPLELLKWLVGLDYRILSFYDQQHRNGALGWMDAMLVR
ncbi:MAG: FkbM family methyltransferase [Phenylobacterium sp.]|uniref:FkbM family methyltransferase n=1 Tax=Phenylobacterium sp. TaxID=1871053 RepID=UPI0027327913|nr:FkbM family methyltransferase [Phenylobacterium sp.]MDP3174185.1 FkbM family methyltransferase [Phenylobacterium sp.]